MPDSTSAWCSRRRFLALTSAAAALSSLPAKASASSSFTLKAAPGKTRFSPGSTAATAVWSYNNKVPGPEIRVRQGDQIQVVVENALSEETTVHWHGVRTPNAMDGVPMLTQVPIAPGEAYLYEFNAIDAGTFWYHPHQRSFEQVGRGLYGPLIIEEREPPRVDRDITWVLDDWRLTGDSQISGDFGNRHDMSHNGRVGNTVTINGKRQETFAVRPNERIRLRLINAANARIFGLNFKGHDPMVIALDGQPIMPHHPEDGLIVLGPAMRADLMIDMTAKAGARHPVTDRFYQGLEYRLVDLAYDAMPLRGRASDWQLALPINPLPEPDIKNAVRHDVVFNGGMMGGMAMAEMGGSMGDGSSGG